MAIIDKYTIDKGPGRWKSYTDNSYCLPKSETPKILQQFSRIYYEAMLKQNIKQEEETQTG